MSIKEIYLCLWLPKKNKDIIYMYTTLIQSRWSHENDIVVPLADYVQKDSYEFINILLNAGERINSPSIILRLFHTPTQSQVTCTGCYFINTTDEITTFLLPITPYSYYPIEMISI